jgi:predicted lipid-binding transport protein (Tim44 family)
VLLFIYFRQSLLFAHRYFYGTITTSAGVLYAGMVLNTRVCSFYKNKKGITRMKKNIRWTFAVLLIMLFVTGVFIENDVYARAGGARSSGSSGSRSYSPPSRSTSNPAAPSQPTSPSSVPAQPAGGGFFRSMGGGLLGGLLGGMLIGSLFGFGGMGGGFGGSGVGIVEIILLGAVGYFIYTMVTRKRREAALEYQGSTSRQNYSAEGPVSYGRGEQTQAAVIPATEGLEHIRQMDSSFDESRFKDTTMDIFFKIQGAWTARELSPASNLLTEEMKRIFQQDIDKLLQERKINRLENIAVRKAEIVESWQETGQDYIRVLFTANLLDYTVEESTGTVIAGSKTDPVKFEECWTFTRPVGNNPWKLSAINQV